MNGKFVPFEEATIHVLACGPLRLQRVRGDSRVRHAARHRDLPSDRHVQRLLDSARSRASTFRTHDELMDATRETVKRNGGKACYIRPVVIADTRRSA
jgi:branched-subunit amino acid aminotransferase/4-amino-4-deoxychorismate lyase